MPRAKRHYIPNQIWHITQRCHKREFLLKFKHDRHGWIQWLFEAKRRFGLVVLGAMAKGRCLQPGEGAFELREAQSVYNAIFDHENRDIDPK